MSKRNQLLESAARIVKDRGVNHLTLDAVAAEAGISKGGLLYHFRSKDELITALNEQAGQQFQTLVQQELEKGSSYTLAYIQATRTQMNEADVLSTDASMLAAIANNREALAMWADEYNQFRIKATEEGVPQELASVIRLVCDGIMFAHLFDLDPPGEEELTRVVQYLEALLKKEKDEVES